MVSTDLIRMTLAVIRQKLPLPVNSQISLPYLFVLSVPVTMRQSKPVSLQEHTQFL